MTQNKAQVDGESITSMLSWDLVVEIVKWNLWLSS